MWQRPVTLVGIILCAIIVITAVLFLCRHFYLKKHNKEKKVQVNQSLLVNGEIAKSPTHSGHSNQGSNTNSYVDVPNSPTRRDYVLAKVSTHPAPPMDLPGIKKHKVRSPVGGREISGDPNYSSVTHPKSPISPHIYDSLNLANPYAANDGRRDYDQDPSQRAKGTTSPTRSRYHKNDKHRHSRSDPHRQRSMSPPQSPHRTTSPHSPSHRRGHHSPRSVSPGSQSPGSRSDSRNQSFKQAVSAPKKEGAPLADCEDLSPTSPTSPSRGRGDYSNRQLPPPPGGAPYRPGYPQPEEEDPRRQFAGMAKGHPMHPISENIPLDTYNKVPYRGTGRGPGDTNFGPNANQTVLPDHRPPVEGGDSRWRDRPHLPPSDKDYLRNRGQPGPQTVHAPSHPDIQNANVIPSNVGHRPNVKPLPLRGVQRPDGQSPEHKSEDPNANTPSSTLSNDLSPLLEKTQLFPASGAQTPDGISLGDQWEYDDYIPEMPGSYFTMDPHAYTLTWSQQKPWAQRKPVNSSRTNSELSVDNNESKA